MLSAQLKNVGFTLIELLLVVSIIIIITGSMIPGFSTYIANQNVNQARDQIRSDLRSLQNKALTGENSLDQVSANILPSYWGVRFIQNATTYSYFISSKAADCPPTTDVLSKGTSRALPGGLVSRVSMCVFFSYSDGSTSTNTAASFPLNIIVGKQGASTNCRRLQIYQGGLIDVSSASIACN